MRKLLIIFLLFPLFLSAQQLGLGLGVTKGVLSSFPDWIPQGEDAVQCFYKIEISGGDTLLKDYFGMDADLRFYDNDTLIEGIPYKSAVYIQQRKANFARINDTTLWYNASDSTGKLVPVVALFQDINYQHKIFCRHISQQVNGLGIELIEPYITDIVTYNSSRTGTDLTECNTYYGVPKEGTVNVKWVAKWGNNTTGDGSKNNPWLTLEKAEDSGTAGDTIYIESGIYTENDGSSKDFIAITQKHWFAVGRVEIRGNIAGGAVQTITSSGNAAVTFRNMIFNFDSTTNGMYATTGTGIKTFNRCMFTGKSKYVAASYQIYVNGSIPIVYNDCVFNGTNTYTNMSLMRSKSVFTMNGCLIGGSAPKGIEDATKALLGTTSVTYCRTKIILGSTYPTFYFSQDSLHLTCNFKWNEFNETKTGAINVTGIPVLNIEYNTFNIPSNNITAAIAVPGNANESSVVTIMYNTFNSRITSNKIIHVGSTSTAATKDNTISLNVCGNKILGENYYNASTSVTGHGVYVGFQKDPVIKHNYIHGAGIGIFVTNAVTTEFTKDSIYANVLAENISGVQFNGVYSANLINNTSFNKNVKGQFFKTPALNKNITVKNNLIVDKHSTGDYLIYLYNNDTVGLTVNNNVYYSQNYSAKMFKNGTELTFARWQSHGYDAASIDTNITFFDEDNYILYPRLVKEHAEDLSSDFQYGLDYSTVFPTNIILHNQNDNPYWQNGAYNGDYPNPF